MHFDVQSDNLTVQEIMNELKHRNLDVTKRVSLSFYIEHKTELSAKQLAKDLNSEGFDTDIDAFQQHLDKWRCWANVSLIPNALNLEWAISLLEDKSRRFEGEVAGWETNPFESGQELGQMMVKFEEVYQQVV